MKKRKPPSSGIITEEAIRAYALNSLRKIRTIIGSCVNPQTGKTIAEETNE